jgi:hypothetical protein
LTFINAALPITQALDIHLMKGISMSVLNDLTSPLFSRRGLLAATAVTAAAATLAAAPKASADEAVDISKLPRVKQKLMAPPFLPESCRGDAHHRREEDRH